FPRFGGCRDNRPEIRFYKGRRVTARVRETFSGRLILERTPLEPLDPDLICRRATDLERTPSADRRPTREGRRRWIRGPAGRRWSRGIPGRDRCTGDRVCSVRPDERATVADRVGARGLDLVRAGVRQGAGEVHAAVTGLIVGAGGVRRAR